VGGAGGQSGLGMGGSGKDSGRQKKC